MSEIKVGDKVNVYLDPFTVSDMEGAAEVITAPKRVGDKDEKGRPMYRCIVKFENEGSGYYRTVSELQ